MLLNNVPNYDQIWWQNWLTWDFRSPQNYQNWTIIHFFVPWQIFSLKSVQTKTIISDARFKNVNPTIKHLTKDLILSMLTTDLLFFHFMSDRAKNNLREETIGNWTRLDYRLLFYGYHCIAAMICNQLSNLCSV